LELESQLHLGDIAEAEVNEKVRMRNGHLWLWRGICAAAQMVHRQCRYLMENEPMFAAVRKLSHCAVNSFCCTFLYTCSWSSLSDIVYIDHNWMGESLLEEIRGEGRGPTINSGIRHISNIEAKGTFFACAPRLLTCEIALGMGLWERFCRTIMSNPWNQRLYSS
jgi:hypothetical protein